MGYVAITCGEAMNALPGVQQAKRLFHVPEPLRSNMVLIHALLQMSAVTSLMSELVTAEVQALVKAFLVHRSCVVAGVRQACAFTRSS